MQIEVPSWTALIVMVFLGISSSGWSIFTTTALAPDQAASPPLPSMSGSLATLPQTSSSAAPGTLSSAVTATSARILSMDASPENGSPRIYLCYTTQPPRALWKQGWKYVPEAGRGRKERRVLGGLFLGLAG